MSAAVQDWGRVGVLATGHTDAAIQAVRGLGVEPVVVLTRADARNLRRFRARLHENHVDTLIIQTRSWERVANPHVYMVAAAAAPVGTRVVLSGDHVELVSRAAASLWAPRVVYDGLEAAPLSLLAARRIGAGKAHDRGAVRGDHVVAIWRGSPENVVGGAITHMSGILAGFRAAGLGVSLASGVPLPPQLEAVVDDAEVVPPLRPSLRMTFDVQRLALGVRLSVAAQQLARRHDPRFVYQRHDAFMTSGRDAAAAIGVPLVLEWNASEVWTRKNWQQRRPFHRPFDLLAETAERRSAKAADVVAAVSAVAGDTAADAGAARDRILVSPNGVDLDSLDRAVAGVQPAPVPTVGWTGTFGLWHGAPLLVRAFARLPDSVRLVLVGDGPERHECRQIATELGVDERIEWCGTLPHGEALRRLAGCTLLASPHVQVEDGQPFFGSPTKLFEYMALRRPVVASDLEQIGEILEDGVTARLVQPNDEAALADAIAGLLGDEASARALASEARREVEARHTWRVRAEQILSRLES
jgi:glycosyltransferase involved in cell wall biosynthesis